MKYYKKSIFNNFPIKFTPQEENFWSIADSVYEGNHRAQNITLLLITLLIILIFIIRFIMR